MDLWISALSMVTSSYHLHSTQAVNLYFAAVGSLSPELLQLLQLLKSRERFRSRDFQA